MRALATTCLLGLAGLPHVGCQNGPGRGEGGDGASLTESVASMEAAGATSGSLSISDNGLEVRMWIVEDDASTIGASFTAHGQDAFAGDALGDTLARNGLRTWKVPLASLPALLESLGGSSVDQRWWFGQVFEWRELFKRSLASRSRGVAIDGRVRGFADGAFSLLVRSWTIKTENGPRLQLDLVPYFVQGAEGPGIRRLSQSGIAAGEAFASVHLSTQLEPGFGYVLTAERPGIDWSPGGESEEPAEVTPAEDRRGGTGPPDLLGPESAGPSTIGETILRGSEHLGNRLLVVLIPRIPATLFPPELLPAALEIERLETSRED